MHVYIVVSLDNALSLLQTDLGLNFFSFKTIFLFYIYIYIFT